jgi:hypothetical protein
MAKSYKDTAYTIYPDGEVQNANTGRFLKPCDNDKGYLKVYLMVNGKKRSKYIHRLVAEIYCKKPRKAKCDQVNHIDGNKSNNHYSNLEFVTNSENQLHCYKLGLKPNAKFNKEEVKSIRRKHKNGQTIKSIAEEYKVLHGTISNIINGISYKYY